MLDGFTFGFKLGFTGENKVRVSKNLRSALENPSVVLGKLQIELKHDKIAGPFPAVPLPEFCVSPIGLVPKKQAGQFRIIHQSYPDGNSINSGIPDVNAPVHYASTDTSFTSFWPKLFTF